VEKYPRYLMPNSPLYDPIELARETRNIVCRIGPKGLERKYTAFYVTGVYGELLQAILLAAASGVCFAGLI
jgi:hypothetical protein